MNEKNVRDSAYVYAVDTIHNVDDVYYGSSNYLYLTTCTILLIDGHFFLFVYPVTPYTQSSFLLF